MRLRGQLRRNEFTVKSYDVERRVGAPPTSRRSIPAGEEITPPRMRALADRALELVPNEPDPLPAELKQRARGCRGAPTRCTRCTGHATLEEAEEGRRRLAFDELLLLQLGLARRTREREQEVAPALGEPGELLDAATGRRCRSS